MTKKLFSFPPKTPRVGQMVKVFVPEKGYVGLAVVVKRERKKDSCSIQIKEKNLDSTPLGSELIFFPEGGWRAMWNFNKGHCKVEITTLC